MRICGCWQTKKGKYGRGNTKDVKAVKDENRVDNPNIIGLGLGGSLTELSLG